METPVPSDAESEHVKAIGLTEDFCRKGYVPDQIKAESDREFTFVISTGAVDRDNDTIKVSGWDLENYRKNPVVLFGHRSDIPPIARAVSVTKSSGVLKARLQFPEPGVSELADTVHGLVKGGFMNATSVGFRPKRDKYAWNEERGGIDFEEQELLEFSLVPVPSNPEAIMTLGKDFAGASAAGIDLGPIRKALALADQATPPVEVKVGLDDAGVTFTRTKDGAVWSVSSGTWVKPTDESADPPVEEKAGRRLSAKTEQSLRSAHKSASEAVDHLNSVLERAEEEMEDGKQVQPEQKVAPAAEPPQVSERKPPVYSDQSIEAAVKRVIATAINRARGRLD